jgi:adenosylhomocysteine nucleosidase
MKLPKIVLTTWLLGCLAFTPLHAARYAVFTAFGLEQAMVEKQILPEPSKVKTEVLTGTTFKIFKFGKNEIISAPTQMSLVNAARMTQFVIDHYKVDGILFTGIAGALDSKIKPGDVTICEKWAYYMEGAMLNEKPGGGYYKPDYLRTHYENYGPFFAEDVEVIREGMSEPKQKAWFEVDEHLLDVAKDAVNAKALVPVDGKPTHIHVGGNGVAGTLFMDNAKLRDFARKLRHAHTLDMESTAIGQVAWINKTPFLVIRGISDLAGGQTGVNSEELHGPKAATNGAIVLKQILEKL